MHALYDERSLTSATDSGKSAAFTVPILHRLVGDLSSRALLLFPTKALAHDQLRSLAELTSSMPELAAALGAGLCAYDGDTPQAQRKGIRASARILLTNPDMLHAGILPNHELWSHFFARLRTVIIDEAHYYSGVLGTHVAWIVRRLLRVCAFYGSQPQLVLCSATISNPAQHATALTGLAVSVIDDDGAPRGPRTVVVWNPSAVGNQLPDAPGAATDESHELAESACIQASQLFVELVRHKLTTLAFYNSRRLAELGLVQARECLQREGLAARVDVYRAGYLPERRRAVERALCAGELIGVTATNALELGIDIGSINAVLSIGVPGSIASLRQQFGRAGRSATPALCIFVPFADLFNQYFAANPALLMHSALDAVPLNFTNAVVMRAQLICAASELPLMLDRLGELPAHVHELPAHVHEPLAPAGFVRRDEPAPGGGQRVPDSVFFGEPALADALRSLLDEGCLTQCTADETSGVAGAHDPVRFRYVRSEFGACPATAVPIRSLDSARYTLRNEQSNEVIETLDTRDALLRAYQGAIYLSEGREHVVTCFDAEARVILARPIQNATYYTKAMDHTAAVLERTIARHFVSAGQVAVTFGVFSVRLFVDFAKKIRKRAKRAFEKFRVDVPSVSFDTQGCSIRLSDACLRALTQAELDVHEAVHAYEHVLRSLAPVLCSCEASDVKTTLCDRSLLVRDAPTLVLVDNAPGGIGVARCLYERCTELLGMARDVLVSCPCASGCPRCVCHADCPENNDMLSKAGALIIAQHLSISSA